MRFVGDPVALVVADSRYIAEDAADLVVVDYEPLPPVVDYVEARVAATSWCTRAIRATSQGRCRVLPPETVEEVFASAPHVVAADDLPAGLRGGADRDARARRGMVAGE